MHENNNKNINAVLKIATFSINESLNASQSANVGLNTEHRVVVFDSVTWEETKNDKHG